jgi:hypothetical protein
MKTNTLRNTIALLLAIAILSNGYGQTIPWTYDDDADWFETDNNPYQGGCCMENGAMTTALARPCPSSAPLTSSSKPN